MDMTIPAIVLFGAMGLGLAMTPSIFRDFIDEVKDAFSKEERTDTL